jgi:cathepsin L
MNVFAVIVTICVLCDRSWAFYLQQLMDVEWNGFKLEHKKVYDSFFEERYRYNVYLANRELIANHNQRYAMGLETYEMGINRLADLTYEEILIKFTGFEQPLVRVFVS